MISCFKKSIFSLGAFLFASVVFSPKAQANFLVGAAYPISHSFTDIDSSEESDFEDTNATGFGLQVVFPLGVLARMDIVHASRSDSEDKNGVHFSTVLISAGYRFDLVSVPAHFALALGTGNSGFVYGAHHYYTEKPIALYLEAGYNIFPTFDLYLAYQKINGGKFSLGDFESKSTLSMDVTFLGFNVAF